jgi:hypothetical protein
MTDQQASDFTPPWALTMWADGEAVYAELPMKPRSYIIRLPFTEAGLHKALMMLKDIHDQINKGPKYVLQDHPAVIKSRRGLSKARQAERAELRQKFGDHATEILRKRGLIK